MADTKKLGAELGEKFARRRALGSVQEREAKLLISEIIAHDPKVKLPPILADEQVKAWQKETGVTDGHLKAALTDARSSLKDKADVDAVKLPRRSRHRNAHVPVTEAGAKNGAIKSDVPVAPGIVPNLSLDLL